MSDPTELHKSPQEVFKVLGLDKVTLIVDEHDVQQLEASAGNRYSLGDAVGLAIMAYITNERGSPAQGNDAPLGLILSDPQAHGLPANATTAQASVKMREYLTSDPKATIVLLSPTTIQQPPYQFTPEYGESLAENWVFRFILPTTLDVLTWVVVDKTGTQTPYSYCVE